MQLLYFYILMLGVTLARTLGPDPCKCEEKVNTCIVVAGSNGLPGTPGSFGLPGRDDKDDAQGITLFFYPSELEVLKTHISALQTELKALQVIASKTQKDKSRSYLYTFGISCIGFQESLP
ncbi:hypothetical protein JD844_006186 [Phrynosoma platyrhinos]|uniref:Uncharacterized protein n=1 Tax=Phrynosoma platyrhinos TaxID=52577 RepID=A0ABQ7T2E3_PHRPL|nr:hypothetical protein JD844_006186 [Phrynosoma platyrhinos]